MKNGNGPLIGGLAIVVIVAAILIYFVYGAPPASPTGTTNGPVTFYCGSNNTFTATFATSSVMIMFPDGSMQTLPQTMSGSGIRYEATSTGADLLFVGKGDYGSFTNSASTTDTRYAQCTAANVSPSSTSGFDTYPDLSKTFTFQFPTDFSVAGIEPGYGPNWSAPATTTGMVLAEIDVPQSYEPGTNFGNAWLTVGTSADSQAVADCTTNLEGQQATSTPVTIGGVNYTVLAFAGAGAGNRYDTTSYRTVKDGQCYAIEYTIHYGVFENYPKGSVKQFDEQKVANALDQVIQSFRFQ
jgi:membrane-bound inhibitor of C-type lysozyme